MTERQPSLGEKKKEEKKRVCYTCSQAEEESRGQMHPGEEKRQGQKAQRSRKPPDTEHRERKLRRLDALLCSFFVKSCQVSDTTTSHSAFSHADILSFFIS